MSKPTGTRSIDPRLADFLFAEWGDEAHDGPGWYYWHDEYPDEGACGAFKHVTEAELHALSSIDPEAAK